MKDKNNFDKEIYNLIDNMENLDELDFDFENIGEEENLSSKDMEKIREKTYKKIENQNIKKYKIKSFHSTSCINWNNGSYSNSK